LAWDEFVNARDDLAPRPARRRRLRCYGRDVKLADRIAQCRAPFVVTCGSSGATRTLNNAADCAHEVSAAPIRFVLSDDLTRLCTALAYSKGARTLACADLIRVPAESVWIEWSCRPWQQELALHAISVGDPAYSPRHRRGALFRASKDGRRGTLRTFWSGDAEEDVVAGCIEAYFDLDTPAGEEPDLPPGWEVPAQRLFDSQQASADLLSRCFRFRYEPSWKQYYGEAALEPAQRAALWRHALGTIALDIPVLCAFFLLLGTRAGLPQSPETFERLNRSRQRAGKLPLLAHVDVRAPLLPDGRPSAGEAGGWNGRRGPRLHHVRGHLVRRGAELFWRVPHLRGNARFGAVRTRTVTWTFAPH
jgi:hypothetical protein